MRRFKVGRLHDLRRCPQCGSVFASHMCGSPSDTLEAGLMTPM